MSLNIPIDRSNFSDIIRDLHAVSVEADADIHQLMTDMAAKISSEGDQAVCAYTAQFDRVSLTQEELVVSQSDIQAAQSEVSEAFKHALDRAYKNIKKFHEKLMPQNWEDVPETGVKYGARYQALDRVGLYVPGGRAVYPSTVLMNAIPAQIAGVSELIMVTPPQPDGRIPAQVLVAAERCGVHKILKMGGAQAVFALAYGTVACPKVNKIVGPGNRYVTAAKQAVFGRVDIDKPAGPSEVLVVVNNPDYARFAAADMLAQLEHDPDAIAITISEDEGVLVQVQSEIQTLKKQCKRQDILDQSLNHARLFLSGGLKQTVELVNDIASEHLVILLDEPESLLNQVRHAGSIFMGPYTPVTLGDYYAGPNHVLPTNGTATFASPLGVMDFMKYSSYLQYSSEALSASVSDLAVLTEMEGLDAHQLAVEVRQKR